MVLKSNYLLVTTNRIARIFRQQRIPPPEYRTSNNFSLHILLQAGYKNMLVLTWYSNTSPFWMY